MEASPEKEGMNQWMDTKYAPELNDIETVWRDRKAHYLVHQICNDTEALHRTMNNVVKAMNVQ
jgi:transposase